jgi:hypothetical protein
VIDNGFKADAQRRPAPKDAIYGWALFNTRVDENHGGIKLAQLIFAGGSAMA